MPAESPLYCGIDLGTSGVRAVCIDDQLSTQASSNIALHQRNADRRNPNACWEAVCSAIHSIAQQVSAKRIQAIAVDGTSGTLIPVSRAGKALANSSLYNDTCSDADVLQAVATHAPQSAAVHGATSALARAIVFADTTDCHKILHEADWIAFKLGAPLGLSDENNALKTGYDPVARQWPLWIENTGIPTDLLPEVVAPGTEHSTICNEAAKACRMSPHTKIVTGTTDGCASFLATGAYKAGDAVSVLGSTLTLKLLSEQPINAPRYGIYSHRIGDQWLAGGASNSGGKVLAHFFTAARIAALSDQIDLTSHTTLDYYPLLSPGERFPINDSEYAPRLSPRPNSDVQFLHGLLAGIANIENQAYERLQELGAPKPASIRTVGGGAKNRAWTAIRRQTLNIPFQQSLSNEAAVGVASLAQKACLNTPPLSELDA